MFNLNKVACCELLKQKQFCGKTSSYQSVRNTPGGLTLSPDSLNKKKKKKKKDIWLEII